jgi:hypothetical protein
MTCKNFEEICNEVLAFCLHEFGWSCRERRTAFLTRYPLLTERLAYRPLQLSVEAYERSVHEGGAHGSGLATFLIKHTRGGRRLHTR